VSEKKKQMTEEKAKQNCLTLLLSEVKGYGDFMGPVYDRDDPEQLNLLLRTMTKLTADYMKEKEASSELVIMLAARREEEHYAREKSLMKSNSRRK